MPASSAAAPMPGGRALNLVLLTHPEFLGLRSQGHFARMLAESLQQRGHQVELRQPRARLHRRVNGRLRKWAGYVDQYLLFPSELRERAARDPFNTLYVFCDQALGPWIPSLAHRPHVVHCHDLLALRSALGLVAENPTSLTGRVYQRYIRAGFRHAQNFISISEQSRADLHAYGGVRPVTSEVVYNGLNHPFRPQTRDQALATLQRLGLPAPEPGLLLHVGGGQWYKNAAGVVHLYARHVARLVAQQQPVPPLWMVSPAPGPALQAALSSVPAAGRVCFHQGLSSAAIEALYALADALLFPSLAEGFGWPIAEALACGCPVITTGEAPMTEVGGPVAHYLPRLQADTGVQAWAEQGADLLAMLQQRTPEQRAAAAQAAVDWSRRYDASKAIEAYLRIYRKVLQRP